MAGVRTYIATDVDFERDGKQVSTLRLPYSQHTAAWGVIPIPIAGDPQWRGADRRAFRRQPR